MSNEDREDREEKFRQEISNRFIEVRRQSSIVGQAYQLGRMYNLSDIYVLMLSIIHMFEAIKISGRQLAEYGALKTVYVTGDFVLKNNKYKDYILQFAIEYASREQQIEDHHFIIDMKQLLLCDDKFARELMEEVKKCRKDLIIVTE